MMNQLKKVNNIQTIDNSDLIKKADCNTQNVELETKIPDHEYDYSQI